MTEFEIKTPGNMTLEETEAFLIKSESELKEKAGREGIASKIYLQAKKLLDHAKNTEKPDYYYRFKKMSAEEQLEYIRTARTIILQRIAEYEGQPINYYVTLKHEIQELDKKKAELERRKLVYMKDNKAKIEFNFKNRYLSKYHKFLTANKIEGHYCPQCDDIVLVYHDHFQELSKFVENNYEHYDWQNFLELERKLRFRAGDFTCIYCGNVYSKATILNYESSLQNTQTVSELKDFVLDTVEKAKKNGTVICKYCGKELDKRGYYNHKKKCKQAHKNGKTNKRGEI